MRCSFGGFQGKLYVRGIELWLKGRLCYPKSTATIFPVSYTLPESWLSSKVSSKYPSLEQGQAFVTNLLIKGSGSYILTSETRIYTYSLCLALYLLALAPGTEPPTCKEAQTWNEATHRCSSQQFQVSVSWRQHQLPRQVRKPLKQLYPHPLSNYLGRNTEQKLPRQPQDWGRW